MNYNITVYVQVVKKVMDPLFQSIFKLIDDRLLNFITQAFPPINFLVIDTVVWESLLHISLQSFLYLLRIGQQLPCNLVGSNKVLCENY